MSKFTEKIVKSAAKQTHKYYTNYQNNKYIYANLFWLFSERALRLSFGLLIGVWIARYLGPEKFGLLNYSLALVSIFKGVSTLGLQEIVVRDLVKSPQKSVVTLSTSTLLIILTSIISCILSFLYIYIFITIEIEVYVISVLSLLLLLAPFEIAVWYFESKLESKYIVWVQNLFFIVFSIIRVYVLIQMNNFKLFIWLLIIESFLSGIFLVLIMKKKGIIIKLRYFSFHRAKELLNDCWPLIIASISVLLYMKVDQIMIGYYMTQKDVGIYSVAVRITEIFYFIPIAITTSFFPSLIKAKELGLDVYYKSIQKLFNLLVFLSLVICIPISFMSKIIVDFLYGDQYHAASPILVIQTWVMLFVFLGVASSRWILIENKIHLSMQRTLAGALINIFMNILLIPKYGLIGASISTLLAQAFSGYVFDLFRRSTYPIFIMKTKAILLISGFRVNQGMDFHK